MLSALTRLAEQLGLISEPDPRGVAACKVVDPSPTVDHIAAVLGRPQPTQPKSPPQLFRLCEGHGGDASGPYLEIMPPDDLPPAA